MPNLYLMAQALSKNLIRHLNSLKIKKYRYSNREFIVEGPKVVEEFITSGWEPVYFFTTNPHLTELTGYENAVLITEAELNKISVLHTQNQVFAVFPMADSSKQRHYNSLWTLAIDGIRDPGNLGTMIRIADWFGINRVICSTDCADPYNPKTVQSSMGSLSRIGVEETELKKYFEENKKVPVYGALLEGTPYREEKYQDGGVSLIGNESTGISENLLPFITHKITIPRVGQAESLNAAIATAIICAELSHR